MPFDSSIYWKHAAAMPQQSDFATGLSGLSRVVKQRAAMDEYDEVQAYKRSQDAQQNQRRDDLLRIQQQQEARQQAEATRLQQTRQSDSEVQNQIRQGLQRIQAPPSQANFRQFDQSGATDKYGLAQQTLSGLGTSQKPFMGYNLAETFKPEEVDTQDGWTAGMKAFAAANPGATAAEAYRGSQQARINEKLAGRTKLEVNTGDSAQIGTIPKGYGFDPVRREMFKIPGGPAAEAEVTGAEKAAGRQQQKARAGTTVIQDLQRAYNIIATNRSASGAPAIVTQHIPESEAQAAKGFIESALSNVGLDTLQTMRENSPTGGALGQVPIQQQKRLEQVLGSLEVTQRRDILEDNLNRVINIYMDIVYGSPKQIQNLVKAGKISAEEAEPLMQRKELSFDDFGNPAKKKTQGGVPKPGTVEDGYRYKGGDPSDQNNWVKVKK